MGFLISLVEAGGLEYISQDGAKTYPDSENRIPTKPLCVRDKEYETLGYPA
jgi:hypothetical protein